MTTAILAALAIALGLVIWRLLILRKRFTTLEAEQSAEAERRGQLERVRAVAEERERIYNDLHDDIGAKLLNLIYGAEKPEQADLARSVLQDLRDVVTRSRGTSGTLLDVLADIRAESEQRLSPLGVGLYWEQDDGVPDPAMDQGHALHLYRIVREALSNALRHARPASVRIRVRHAAKTLLLDVTDAGGDATAPVQVGAGRGTVTMQERAAELHGSIAWSPGTQGGTKVVLQFPLP